jgi:hypothetical protein
MALAGRRFGWERRGFPVGTSFCSGTTHARSAGEVERNASNLMALLPAEWWNRPRRADQMPRSRILIAGLGSVRQHVARSEGG